MSLGAVPEIAGIFPEVSRLFFKTRAKRPYLSHTDRASLAAPRFAIKMALGQGSVRAGVDATPLGSGGASPYGPF
jgi:hypothetical protein